MAKYSQEFKLEVVQYYLSGFGKTSVGKRFNVHPNDVVKWVSAFQHHGVLALKHKNTKTVFSVEFKMTVVEKILNDGITFSEAMQEFNLRDKAIIANWLRRYKENGIEGLKPKPKGRPKRMPKPQRPRIKTSQEDRDKTQEQLLDEIAYLRTEVAYLKKRRALIQKHKEQEQAEQQRLQDSYLN